MNRWLYIVLIIIELIGETNYHSSNAVVQSQFRWIRREELYDLQNNG